MAIGANSYGTVAEVVAVTRHLLDGAATFDGTTRPTLTEVEAFIDRVSGTLNTAIANTGLTVPISQADAKLACDDWVISKAVQWIELSQPGRGWEASRRERGEMFKTLYADAQKFVVASALGWKRLGAGVTTARSEGFEYTAMTIHSERADPDVTTREQPLFRRGLFDR